MVEVGAGEGALTRELAAAAASVIAIERDPALARTLRRRFAGISNVEVVHGDGLIVPLPEEPFRVVANIPFGITTGLLRRLLDDPASPLTAADLVVQRAVADKRVRVPPRNLLSLIWGPWWTFGRGQSLPAGLFHPRPSVDAAVLRVRPRTPSMIAGDVRPEYVRVLRHAFERAGEPLPRALRAVVPTGQTLRALQDLGFTRSARPVDLSVEEWVALYLRLSR